MSDEQKPGDPADRAADGAFGGVQSHRSGYGDDRLARLTEWLRAHPTATLASGEGALLLGEIDRQRGDRDNLSSQLRICTYNHDGWKQRAERFERKIAGLQEESTLVVAERDRLKRILAALREPSDAVLYAAHRQLKGISPAYLVSVIGAAVAAAEQEVGA